MQDFQSPYSHVMSAVVVNEGSSITFSNGKVGYAVEADKNQQSNKWNDLTLWNYFEWIPGTGSSLSKLLPSL